MKARFRTGARHFYLSPVRTLLIRVLVLGVAVLAACGGRAAVTFTSLHSFQVFTNGNTPNAGLLLGKDGDYYGTTYYGGTNGGSGTIFKLGTNGALITLYSFGGGAEGAYPDGGLVQG